MTTKHKYKAITLSSNVEVFNRLLLDYKKALIDLMDGKGSKGTLLAIDTILYCGGNYPEGGVGVDETLIEEIEGLLEKYINENK